MAYEESNGPYLLTVRVRFVGVSGLGSFPKLKSWRCLRLATRLLQKRLWYFYCIEIFQYTVKVGYKILARRLLNGELTMALFLQYSAQAFVLDLIIDLLTSSARKSYFSELQPVANAALQ